LLRIPTFTSDTTFHVVVESPRASAVKLKHEPRWPAAAPRTAKPVQLNQSWSRSAGLRLHDLWHGCESSARGRGPRSRRRVDHRSSVSADAEHYAPIRLTYRIFNRATVKLRRTHRSTAVELARPVKSEVADRFESRGDAKMELFDYTEVVYNQRRRHSTLGQIAPAASNAWRMTQRS
jgi:hypothetical protein